MKALFANLTKQDYRLSDRPRPRLKTVEELENERRRVHFLCDSIINGVWERTLSEAAVNRLLARLHAATKARRKAHGCDTAPIHAQYKEPEIEINFEAS